MKKSMGQLTLLFPTPVWLIGTYDQQGMPNIMAAAWAGICCSKPPCVGVSLRKATYSYHSIVARKAFTVNVPARGHVEAVDYSGLVSGRDNDKFADAGLTAVRSTLVDAPYVEEFPLVVECRLFKTLELGLHTQFVGEIMDVKADEAVLDERGLPSLEKVDPLLFAPEAWRYYSVGQAIGQAFEIGKKLKRPSC
jgi:flavin reductase (DIM6/NTAB) family NADH-FMN oxidoreductase RutF